MRMELLMQNCKKRKEAVHTIISELTAKCEAIAQVQNMLDEVYRATQGKEDKVSSMQERVVDAESNPTFAAYLQCDLDLRTSTQSSVFPFTGSASSVYGSHAMKSDVYRFQPRRTSASISPALGRNSPSLVYSLLNACKLIGLDPLNLALAVPNLRFR